MSDELFNLLLGEALAKSGHLPANSHDLVVAALKNHGNYPPGDLIFHLRMRKGLCQIDGRFFFPPLLLRIRAESVYVTKVEGDSAGMQPREFSA